MENNINTIKEITDLGKNLMNMAGMGNKLSEDDINNKPIMDVGITGSMFNDMANMGKKMNDISKITSLLATLGINKDMINQVLKMANTLMQVGDKGNKSINSKSNDTLKDIGLNMGTFKDMDKIGKTMTDLSKMTDILGSSKSGKESMDSKKIMDGISGVLGMMKNK